jgi:hypothetical protein
VTTFIVETYMPASAAARLSHLEMCRVARALALGAEVRHPWSLFIPEDETCFHLLEGPSADAVSEAALRAAIGFERVVEVVQMCADGSAPGKEER